MNSGTFSAYLNTTPHLRRRYLLVTVLLLLTFACAPTIFAQDDDTDPAPPPLKLVPKADLSQLSEESNLKNRAKLTLTLMEGHLVLAERMSTGSDPKGAFRELGFFQALMEDSLFVLEKNDLSSGKTLDALRKFEIGLRAFMPRLETVRRDLPLDCNEYVHKLMASLRDVRAKAIDPMFSDNVVKTKNDR